MTTKGGQMIYTPDQPRWHALCVMSQKETKAEAWLSERDVYSFHPVTHKQRTVRGRTIKVTSRYLPGYVFARFPGIAITHKVLDCMWIYDAVKLTQSKEWGILVPEDLRRIHAMRDVDMSADEAMRRAKAINVGSKVKVLSGVMGEGMEAEVIEITSNGARVKLHMFGRETKAEVSLDNLRKVG